MHSDFNPYVSSKCGFQALCNSTRRINLLLAHSSKHRNLRNKFLNDLCNPLRLRSLGIMGTGSFPSFCGSVSWLKQSRRQRLRNLSTAAKPVLHSGARITSTSSIVWSFAWSFSVIFCLIRWNSSGRLSLIRLLDCCVIDPDCNISLSQFYPKRVLEHASPDLPLTGSYQSARWPGRFQCYSHSNRDMKSARRCRASASRWG